MISVRTHTKEWNEIKIAFQDMSRNRITKKENPKWTESGKDNFRESNENLGSDPHQKYTRDKRRISDIEDAIEQMDTLAK